MYKHVVHGTRKGSVVLHESLPCMYAVVAFSHILGTQVIMALSYQLALRYSTSLSHAEELAIVHMAQSPDMIRVGNLDSPATLWVKKEI